MTQGFLFHIDLILTVALVIHKWQPIQALIEKCHFGPQFGGLIDNFFKKIYISTAKYQQIEYI